MKPWADRLRRNARSKEDADHDGEPWTHDELEWLASWDGTEEELAELAELLGRTIEACRQRFYLGRRRGWAYRTTTTVTTTTVTIREKVCTECWLVHAPAQEECS